MNAKRKSHVSTLLMCLIVSSAFIAGIGGEAMAQKRYTQWTWSNADVRSVFHELSKISGVDIVLSPNVSGNVTLTVTNKTWKDVFNIVCKIRQLSVLKEKGYLFVLTTQEYNEQLRKSATEQKATQQLAPLRREIIRLSNTTAGEMQQSIVPLLSERGKITVADHANALIVFDTDENIGQISKMIAKLDIETEQIAISAKIIEVSSGTLQNMGVQWGFFSETDNGTLGGIHIPDDAGDGIITSPLERLSFGVVGQDVFSATLEYLFEDNKGEVVAQPSITTLDNREAKIFMGGKIPFIRKDEAGNDIITFQDAGTELTVTPHVTDGRRIMLNLNAKKESFNAVTRDISSQSATTNVVVNNGETVVIAGLTSNEVSDNESGIPLLKDIPLLGHLFKKSNQSNNKRDLLIFVTPNIIQKDIEQVSEDSAITGE
ncbi:MAG: hypothetical protein GF398_09555 [Chitinivibrionales bacterium]|nr:hypothetical protein [Chitinivibrionales bacterium]